MTEIVPENNKRPRWLWLAGTLFLSLVFILLMRNFTKERVDPLTAEERAWLKAHPVIRLAPDPGSPPFQYFDKTGEYNGITKDYVSLIEKKLGVRFKIARLRDKNEIINKAKSREIDIYLGTKTPQRSEYMLFTKPFLEFPAVIITREKVKAPLNLEKMNGMKVSVVSEHAAHDFIAYNYPKLNLDPVSDVETGLRKVSFGLSDAYVENLATATYYIEKEGITNLRVAGESGYFYRTGIASRKDLPELNRILEKGLAAISADDKKAIYKKWIPVEFRSLLHSKEFKTIVFSAFSVAVLVILGIFAWNRTLARQVRRRTEELEKELSERRLAEDALRESQEKFRVLAETSPVAIIVYQGEKQVYVNPAATRLIGYTEQDCLDMKFWEWAHEDFKERVRYRGLARQRGEPAPPQYEFKCVTKSGEEKWVVVSAGQIEYKGAPAGIASIFDITERKRMEEELRHAREELEKRVEERTADLRHAKELLEEEITVRNRTESVITARLRLLEFAATHNLDELLEATLDEAEALTGSLIGFYHFLEADQKTLFLRNWSTRTKAEFCKAEGKGRRYDISAAGVWTDCIHERRPVIHNDYASIPNRKGLPPDHPPVIRELVVPVFRGDQIVAILGVGNKPLDYTSEDVEGVSLLADLAWEIAERKEAEEALRESRAKYQAIVDSFDGLIYICSQDYRVEFMNRKIIERTGRDAVGELCYKVLHDRDSVCPWCVNDRVFAGETVHWDMFSPKDKRWYEVLNVPIHHADGSTSKHSMMVDINDRKLFAEELQRQKKLLEELTDTLEKRVKEEVRKNLEKDFMLMQQNRQAALGEMLDHIAHQWKQPLNSIALIVQDMADTSSDGELTDEDVQATTGKIMSLLEHMAQTIDVFRGFHRPDKEKKVFSIKDSVDQALAFISPAFRFQSIAVELDVDPGLTAFGYPKEYAQVLLNLLANARDVFRARGTEKPRVTIRAFGEDNKSVVTISDNAGGISEAIMGRIFDFCFTTNESGGGTGIGLYMSKNIIEKNMGGTLSAANTDEGARFRIEISPA